MNQQDVHRDDLGASQLIDHRLQGLGESLYATLQAGRCPKAIVSNLRLPMEVVSSWPRPDNLA